MARSKNVSPSEESLLISTLHYRKLVGFMGIFLAPVLYIFSGRVFPHSISDYYHTSSGNIFVGTMCAIGVFLCCYRGYDLGDHVAAYWRGWRPFRSGFVPRLPMALLESLVFWVRSIGPAQDCFSLPLPTFVYSNSFKPEKRRVLYPRLKNYGEIGCTAFAGE